MFCYIIIALIPASLLIPFLFLGQAKGGGLSFLQGNPSFLEENISDGNAPKELLVYVNGDHEYVLFDPYSNEANEVSMARRKGLVELEETGGVSFTRTSIVLVKSMLSYGNFNRCTWLLLIFLENNLTVVVTSHLLKCPPSLLFLVIGKLRINMLGPESRTVPFTLLQELKVSFKLEFISSPIVLIFFWGKKKLYWKWGSASCIHRLYR